MANSQQQLPGDPYFVGGKDVGIPDGGTGASTLPTGILLGDGTNLINSTPYTSPTTFSPTVTLVGGEGNTVPVYTTNTGRYTRIGAQVFVDVYLTGDGGAEGAGTGRVNIAIPINSGASHPPSIFPCGYSDNGGVEREIYGYIASGTSTIELVYFTTLGDEVDFTGADQNNAVRTIRLKFFYEV